ncbi:Hypothetical protein J6898_03416 [Nakaseomyces glabratus]
MTDYYEPINIFRQCAISVKKRGQEHGLDVATRRVASWQRSAKLNSPTLRKVSDDYFLTKKVKSDYWQVSDMDLSATAFSSVGNLVMVTSNKDQDNVKLYTYAEDPNSMRQLQTITVPGAPITTATLLPAAEFNPTAYVPDHEQLLLTGHRDGIVNLISTSFTKGESRIVKRYNHRKHLVSMANEVMNIDTKHKDEIEQLLANHKQKNNSARAMPVRSIKPWNGMGFVSLINDSLFVFTLNNTKTPQYLNSFPGIQSFAIQTHSNPYLLGLTGTHFGANNIALLDLKKTLYIPDPVIDKEYRKSSSRSVSSDCTWISSCYLAQALGKEVNIWDVRRTDGKPKAKILPNKGVIEHLSYHYETDTLFSSDDQGNIIAWDLTNLDRLEYCGLVHGLDAVKYNMNLPINDSNYSQCGNVVVNGNNNSACTYRKLARKIEVNQRAGTLFSYCDHELGLHRLFSAPVEISLQLSDTETINYESEEEEVMVHVDKLHDNSHENSSILHSDSTTLHSRDFDSYSDNESANTTDNDNELAYMDTFKRPVPAFLDEKVAAYNNPVLSSSSSTLAYGYF